jgi:hypothetical protein
MAENVCKDCVYVVVCNNEYGELDYFNPLRAFFDSNLAEEYQKNIEKENPNISVSIYPTYPYVGDTQIKK